MTIRAFSFKGLYESSYFCKYTLAEVKTGRKIDEVREKYEMATSENTTKKPMKKGGEEMTKEEIRKILNKKKWTGADVGRILLNSIILSTVLESEQERELIVPYSTIEEMTKTLSPRAFEHYRTYALIATWAGEERNKALQKKYFAQMRSEEVIHPLLEFETADLIERSIQYMPVVMTEKQYQTERNRRIADMVRLTNDIKYTINDLILLGISYYLESAAGKEKQAQVFSTKGLEEITAFNKKYSSLKAMRADADETLQGAPGAADAAVLLISKQYPNIVNDVRRDLENHFPEIPNLSDEEKKKKIYDGYQIVQRNYLEGSKLLEDSRLFLTNYRATQNGIAIIKQPGENKKNLNDEGGYISKYWDLKKIAGILSIDFYSKEAGSEEAYTVMKEARQEFGEALYWLDAYNAVLNALAEIYKVPTIKRFRVDISPIISRVNFYNHHLRTINNWFNVENYDAEKNRKRKLDTLHDVFPAITDSEIIVSEEKVKSIHAMLKKHETFRQRYRIMDYAGTKSLD